MKNYLRTTDFLLTLNLNGDDTVVKPGPKPIAKSTGKVDQRRRDNKSTPSNNNNLKPSKKNNFN